MSSSRTESSLYVVSVDGTGGKWLCAGQRDPEAFRQFSAVDHASKVTTRLLILHGEADVRVPTYQAREFFEALAARGKTVRMVTYPGSPHFPVLWQQRLDVAHEIIKWLVLYNKKR